MSSHNTRCGGITPHINVKVTNATPTIHIVKAEKVKKSMMGLWFHRVPPACVLPAGLSSDRVISSHLDSRIETICSTVV